MKKQSKNYKLGICIGIIMGVILTSGVAYAATVLGASSVSYNNSSSKLSSTTVQGAIDEIYKKATGEDIVYNNKNIVGAYTYDESTCKTGNENTCKKTDCPNDSSWNSCPSGTIIKYKVNGNTMKTFNVLYGDQTTLTLQDSENTVSSVKWYDGGDDNSKGPITALEALELATNSWSNVNTINYTMGITKFKINEYTGCDYAGNCTINIYTLGEKSVKARMITAQEAAAVGCKSNHYSCPKWLGTSGNYWTMSSDKVFSYSALNIHAGYGYLNGSNATLDFGARAVVVISK